MSDMLLHRSMIEQLPVVGSQVAECLGGFALDAYGRSAPDTDGLTVVVRTLNERGTLEPLMQDIRDSRHGRDAEVVVVDNESSDGTPDVARAYGATVVTLARGEFTHPRSMNMGMEAASNERVLLTVGHALFSNKQILHRSAELLANGAVGAFGPVLPNANASKTELGLMAGLEVVTKSLRRPEQIERAAIGVMGATNAALLKSAWKEFGRFDEAYERGGEDTFMARLMLAEGKAIWRDPLLAVHHTHGLGPVNFAKQAWQWFRTTIGPQKLDRRQWSKRRPDLNMFD